MSSNRTVLEFSEVLDTLLTAGLSLKDALAISQTVLEKPGPRRLIAGLSQRVSDGSSFSQAVDAMPDFFPPVYRGIVRIGERVGSLESVFGRLVRYLKTRHLMREKLVSALLYPIIVLIVATGVMVVLAIVVLPRMEEAFGAFGGPAAEQLQTVFVRIRVIGIGFGSMLVLAAVFVGVVAVARRGGGAVAAAIDTAWLRLPLIGALAVNTRVLQLLFALETLTAGGVPLDMALAESGVAVGDHAIRNVARRCAERIRMGMPLSRALDMEALLPRRISLWVQIGERTGNISSVFSQLRAYYQEENERWSERFMSLIEPVLMIVVGIGVIGMIVGVVLPVFQAFGGLL